MLTGFWWGSLREGDHLEDLDAGGRIILEWIFKKWDVAWTGLVWLRIGTGSRLLWMPFLKIGFHKIPGISWLAENRLASEGLLHGVGYCFSIASGVNSMCFNVTFYLRRLPCIVFLLTHFFCRDRLCGQVVRVSGYRYRGLRFDSRRYQIFWVVVGLERGPLSLVRSIEELLE